MTMYTKKFLERLYFNLPPLVPESIQREIGQAMNAELGSLSQLEDTIIALSKKVWPYEQAFEELVKKYIGEMSERLLLQKASYALRRAILHYQKTAAGSWEGLYSGAVVNLFTPEERVELHQILVDINCDVREFVRQAALTVDRNFYEDRIEYYRGRLATIERELRRLQALADSEENEFLAQEIRQHVRAFELGIASMGPKVDYDAVCNAHEHFMGRKIELRTRV